MRGSNNTDLFDPKTEMDSNFSRHGSSSEGDFGFAFNDSNFSDRLLRIEILGGPSDSRSDAEGCTSIADWARHRKRRREDNKKDNGVAISDIVACAEEQILTDNNQPDMDDAPGGDNLDDEGEAMVEEALSGDDDASSEPNWGIDCSTVVRVKELHISSPILAAKSPFFYKLFSNGMRESEQRHVTLRISAQEEGALMELLNFMYSNSLSVTTAPALLDVLMAADKFEVASCMRYCSRLLRNMPMTPDSALLYLELPSSVLMAEAVQPLTDAAKQFLASRYKDITKFHDEVMALPLAGIEAILSSDDLQIASEDAVYDFVLKWARGQYSSLEDRREILGSRLALYIRFPYMTCRKLKKVLTCSDFEHEVASKQVLEALFFKAEAPHRQRILAAEGSDSMNRRFIERAYKYRPVKVVEFELPRPQCVVYLDLKREECAGLFPSGRVYSQAFHLGGQGFFLSAHCNMDQQIHFSSKPLKMKHNNVIPSSHFRKHWQNYVKTWFNQPARKTRRRVARQKKAVKIFPRPTSGPLRPVVHGQTLKYNMKVRAGKGFTLEELKVAGIPKKLAPTIGISVDHRRKNRSLEGLQSNVQRLKTYKAKLVVFPRRSRQVKAGDSTPEELANATQVQGDYMPIASVKAAMELVKLTADLKAFKAYDKIRLERTNARHAGARAKRAAEAEKEEKK